MILNLIWLAVICTCINESGFVDNIEKFISKKFYRNSVTVNFGKLFHCSLCQTFWTGLVYLLVTGCVSIPNIGIVLLIAYSTNMMASLLHFVIDTFDSAISFLDKILNIKK